jgi:polyisoprenoid-binding protein YceI
MTNSSALALAQLTGAIELDHAHTRLGFSVRHMVTRVHGQFTDFRGTGYLAAPDLHGSTLEVAIDAASIQTNQRDRDSHLRSSDFLEVEAYPIISFRATGARRLPDSDEVLLTGDLTIKAITRPVDLTFTYHGTGTDPYGYVRMGFTGSGTLSRKDWGLNWNVALETGGFVLGDEVTLELDVSAILSPSE